MQVNLSLFGIGAMKTLICADSSWRKQHRDLPYFKFCSRETLHRSIYTSYKLRALPHNFHCNIMMVFPSFKMFSPISTLRSRPTTPTLRHDDLSIPTTFALLPSYRPVSPRERSDRPASRCVSPLCRQASMEHISQPQRSSEDDVLLSSGMHSSGVHSVGDESNEVV